MSVGRVAHDVDVFETGATIQPDVTQILPEKSEPFAEKKDGDERQNDNGDERVATEKALMKSSARQRRTAIGATIGGAATTSAIL